MPKHLKVRAVVNKDRKAFTLFVLEKTHSYLEFGGGQPEVPYSHRGQMFRCGNVILGDNNVSNCIVSDLSRKSSWEPTHAKDIKLVLVMCKGPLYSIPVEYWTDIKRTVESYNEFYKDK